MIVQMFVKMVSVEHVVMTPKVKLTPRCSADGLIVSLQHVAQVSAEHRVNSKLAVRLGYLP